MSRVLNLSEAANAVGLSNAQVERMLKGGVLQPARRAKARGSANIFDERDLAVLGIARQLLGQRWPLEVIARVTSMIYSMPWGTIEECLAAGRTHLIATSMNGAAPRLIEAGDLGLFAPVLTKAVQAGHGTAVIDLGLCVSRVKAFLAARREAAKAAESTGARN